MKMPSPEVCLKNQKGVSDEKQGWNTIPRSEAHRAGHLAEQKLSTKGQQAFHYCFRRGTNCSIKAAWALTRGLSRSVCLSVLWRIPRRSQTESCITKGGGMKNDCQCPTRTDDTGLPLSQPQDEGDGEAAPSPRKSFVEASEPQTATKDEQNIKSLWTALQVAEQQVGKRGLQFGEAMYEYRERHSASGRRTDLVSSETRLETFEELCDRLNIPRATAYRWIARYEESIGTRLPKPNPPTSHNPPNRPNETTSCEVIVKAEPTAAQTTSSVTPSVNSASPIPIAPTVVSYEERDREELRHLVTRLDSLSIALQQVFDGKAKWSKYAEYAQVVFLAEKIAKLVECDVTETMTTKAAA